MRTELHTVPPSMSLEELVEDHVYRHHFKMFPVVENDRLIGCVTTGGVKEVPREQWPRRTVDDRRSRFDASIFRHVLVRIRPNEVHFSFSAGVGCGGAAPG